MAFFKPPLNEPILFLKRVSPFPAGQEEDRAIWKAGLEAKVSSMAHSKARHSQPIPISNTGLSY